MKKNDFLIKCINKFGNRYDYSLVDNFNNKKHKINIICKEHGNFWQTPYFHLKSMHGCPTCAKIATKNKKTTTLEKFIIKANINHNNKYNYNFVKFKTLKDKIIIICPNHGKFEQTAIIHLKSGCIQCRNDKYRKSLNEFKRQASIIHNNKYNYDHIDNYINNKQKILIECMIHGMFKLTVLSHLSGNGCNKCNKYSKNLELIKAFIDKSKFIHGNKYDYSKLNANTFKIDSKLEIICKKHGVFKQIGWQHTDGSNCPKCTNENRRLNINEFLEKAYNIHGDKYNYSAVKFEYVSDKININCYKHGNFKQSVASHLYAKQGCPHCSKLISKQETEWLDHLNISIEYRNKKVKIGDKIFFPDGYDPITNTIYEFYGDYWHGNLNVYNPNKINKLNKMKFIDLYNRTIERESFIKLNGYNVVSIWESDWNKLKRLGV